MQQQKMEEVTDLKTAMQKAGHKKVELPPDAEIPEEFEPESTPPVDTSTPATEQPQQTGKKPEPKATPKQPSEEELKRRGFQAEAERSKQKAEQLTRENEILRQIALQNRALQQQQRPPEPEEPKFKEPRLEDYIKDYDPDEGISLTDNRYQAYLRDRDNYLVNVATHNATTQTRREIETSQRQATTMARAKRLAEKYPYEFKDPLTGEPDLNRIQAWLTSLPSDDTDDWVTLREFQDYRSGLRAAPEPEPVAVPPSVVEAPPTTEARMEPDIDEDLLKIGKIYGRLSLPPDFDGLT
ncbi:MAG: hypothetical protein KKD77_20160 [Gammaproteobacteria bacterium]|nr:hypothetical protein [Gammaproteobacteria bacterium]